MTQPAAYSPSSVFCTSEADLDTLPMAEGITKNLYGTDAYIQSAGVKSDLDIDGFAIAVCKELDVELSRHRSRSFDEMEISGDELSSFDLIIALSPNSQRRALELTLHSHLQVEYWPILDPTGVGESRQDRLMSYRKTRDQIRNRLIERWGTGKS